MLFLAAGLLQDKAREKGLVNVYFFQRPIALYKTRQFQNNSDERKDTKDCITVGLKNRFLFSNIDNYTILANFLLSNLYLLLYVPKKTIPNKNVYSI